MKNSIRMGLFLGALFGSFHAVAALNLVTNGGFENGSTGWTEWNNDVWATSDFQNFYTNASVIHQPSYYPYAGLASHEQHVLGAGVHGGLLQVVDVMPGHIYEVSGAWSCGIGGTAANPPTYGWFEVSVYDGAVDYTVVDQAPNEGPREHDVEVAKVSSDGAKVTFDWASFSGTFTANSNQVTLALKAGKVGDTDYIACHHDQLSIVDRGWPGMPIPTLSQWALLLVTVLLGVGGFLGLRRL